jgi:hypothetical protein
MRHHPPLDAPPATPGPPPSFPSTFELLAAHRLPTSWTHIVAGRFTAAPFSDLLFYDQATGSVELHSTDGQGGLTRFASHNIGAGWTDLLTGKFSDTQFTSLFLYSRARGVAELHVTDGQGNLNRIRSYPDWGFWTHLTTVAVPNSDYAALVLYQQAAGRGEVRRCEGAGNFSVYKASDGWRKTWTHVVGDWWSGTSLLFCEASTGHCEVYTLHNDSTSSKPDDPDTPNNPGDLGTMYQRDGMPPATDIVAGNFGWVDTGFLFYDRTTGSARFVFLALAYDVTISLGAESYAGWRTTWDTIVPGLFWEPDPEYTKFQNGFSDLFFYDRNAGLGEVWLHEPYAPNVAEPLEGFASSGSVLPGETIAFHVNSNIGGPFAIRIVRQGESEIPMADLPDVQWSPVPYPIGRLDYRDGPDWPPAAELTIPPDWPSGLYLARLDGVEQVASATIPFVVRAVEPGAQSSILVMIPDTTYEAYNFWGGRSLYGYRTDIGLGVPLLVWSYGSRSDQPDLRQQPRAFRVSSRRPGAVDPGTWPRWQHWEVPLFRWLARQGIDVEVCTATDVHRDQLEQAGILGRYALVVSIGHDEYWSKEMRDNVEGFTQAGGNVVFLSGNVCWFQIRLDPDTNQQVCYKDATFDPLASSDPARTTVNWFDHPVCRAETALTGLSWLDPRDPSALYWVREPDHWVFNGVDDISRSFFGLYRDGDILATVVGNETDRYQSERAPCRPLSPEGFLVLAETGAFKEENNQTVLDKNLPACTMGIWSNGAGQVFTAATLNWSLGLSQDVYWSAIDQITLNLLRTLGARWNGPGTLSTVRDLVAVAGHWSGGDGRHLVVLGRTNGKLHEIYWRPAQVGIEGEDDLPVAFAVDSIVAVASLYDSEQQRHIVIVATRDGHLTEVFWKADTVGIEGSDTLPVTFAPGSIVSVSGLYDPDQQRYVVLVATTAGKVHEIWWKADTVGVEGHDDLPVAFAHGSINGVSALYNADDRRYVVVVGTTAGKVHEIFWKADTAGIEGHDDLPVSFPAGIVAVSGFYDRARRQHVVAVGTRDGTIQRMYWESTSVGIDVVGLVGRVEPDSLVGLAAFYSDGDGIEHIVAGQSNGVVSEWWIKPASRSGAAARGIPWIRNPIVKPWVTWGATDLTAQAGAPLTGGSEGVHAYAAGSRQYVTWLPVSDGVAFEVHELEFDGQQWVDHDLTALGGGPPASLAPPVGYTFVARGSTRHVIYLGPPASGGGELHVHELWLDGSGWHHNDLTTSAGAPTGAGRPVLVPPCAYVCDFDGTQHVDYIGEDGHVHELWWDEDGWHHHDLTAASGAPPAATELGPAGYMSNNWRTQHVDYIGADGRLHEIRWANGSWTVNDPDCGPLDAAPAAPVGYIGGDGVQRVVYLASDSHLHELSFDGVAWDDQDANDLTGTLSGFAAKLAAWRADLTGTRHIIAIPEGGGRTDDLRHDVDGWHYADLATVSPSIGPDAGTRPAGYAVASGKHWVFYTSINFRIIALTWPSPLVLTNPGSVVASREG